MRVLLQRFLRRTGIGSDVARMAALAAAALLLGVCFNALAPAGLPLWPAPGQQAAVPTAIGGQIRFADLKTVTPADGVLVDVREPRDYAAAHPVSALNLPYRQFNSLFPSFSATVKLHTPVYLYCYGGECSTSRRIASRLLQSGYASVTIIRGGFEAWEGRSLVRSGGGSPGG
ncbi:MAG: rhodanese-like domain-containing protein [Armatimonadota bacterium]